MYVEGPEDAADNPGCNSTYADDVDGSNPSKGTKFWAVGLGPARRGEFESRTVHKK